MTEVKIIKEGEKKPVKPVVKGKGRADVPVLKKKLITRIADLIDKNDIIGIVNMKHLPAKQLGKMRAQLRGKVVLLMTKKRFMRLAIAKSKKQNIKELEKYIKGMPAILVTDENPFSLFKLLKKNKSTAPIKGGQIAPNDLVVPAGPTGFSPGPIIGELGGFRIKAGIEDGKVAIKEDSVVAKEGDEVSDKLAGLLTRLGIEPMEIGLDLVAVYEKGEILTKDVLDIDEEAFMNNLRTLASESFNLAMFIGYPNKDTIEPLLSKAHREARAVAKEANVMTSDNVGEVLAKAEAQANALKAKVPDAPKEEKKEEPKKEEPKAEEKPAEEKKEEKKEDKEKAAGAEPKGQEVKPEEKKPEEKKEEKKEEKPNVQPDNQSKEEK